MRHNTMLIRSFLSIYKVYFVLVRGIYILYNARTDHVITN